jgi:hypothetical protein
MLATYWNHETRRIEKETMQYRVEPAEVNEHYYRIYGDELITLHDEDGNVVWNAPDEVVNEIFERIANI